MEFPVVFLADVNTLASNTIRGYLLDMQYREHLRYVRWSQHILDTYCIVAPRRGYQTEEQAKDYVELLKSRFKDAMVEISPEAAKKVVELNWPDENDDRKVAAALISSDADILITNDEGSGFPPDLMAEIGKVKMTSDEFLTEIFIGNPAKALALFSQHRKELQENYIVDDRQILAALVSAELLEFAKHIGKEIGIEAPSEAEAKLMTKDRWEVRETKPQVSAKDNNSAIVVNNSTTALGHTANPTTSNESLPSQPQTSKHSLSSQSASQLNMTGAGGLAARCGELMPRAGVPCARIAGHAGPHRSPQSYYRHK